MELKLQLEERVRLLDLVPRHDLAEALAGFIRCLENSWIGHGETPQALQAAEVDDIVASSQFISDLRRIFPSLVQADRHIPRQLWARFTMPSWVKQIPNDLDPTLFRDFSQSFAVRSSKPWGLGLFTSSAISYDRSMWHLYASNGPDSSVLKPPCRTFVVFPFSAARVAQISSAGDWAQLVQSAAVMHDGYAYPDWMALSRTYDGIRMLLPAIVATQDICISQSGLRIAPPHWSVESTLWLRWCFERTEVVVATDDVADKSADAS